MYLFPAEYQSNTLVVMFKFLFFLFMFSSINLSVGCVYPLPSRQSRNVWPNFRIVQTEKSYLIMLSKFPEVCRIRNISEI